MKFKLTKEVEGPVICYTGEMIETGDVIDLPQHLALKARKNPNYAEVRDTVKKAKVAKNDDKSGIGTTSG